MLVLLSSSARRRYRDDIVRILACPSGTDVRFRYSAKYIESSCASKYIQTGAPKIEGLVCHIAQLPDNGLILVPCRFVTVIKTERVGTSVVFTLRVAEFVKSLDDAGLRRLLEPSESELLPTGANLQGSFVFEISSALEPFKAAENDAMEAFEATTAKLQESAKFEGHQPIAFFNVRHLQEATGGVILKPQEGRYELKSGCRYFLDVYSYSPEGESNPSEATTLSASADNSELNFSSGTVASLDSRYDLNRFAFSTEQRLFEIPAGLRLALGIPKTSGNADIEQRCDIMLDLRFRGSLQLALARIIVIAIGTSAPAALAAFSAKNLSVGLTLLMFFFAFVAGTASVFPKIKKF